MIRCFAVSVSSPRTVSAEWRHFDAQSVITCRTILSVSDEWEAMSEEERRKFENVESISPELCKKYPATYLRVALEAAEAGSSEAARLLPNSCEEKYEFVEDACPRDAAEMAFFRLARAMVDWRSKCNPLLPPLLDYSLDRADVLLHEPFVGTESTTLDDETAARLLTSHHIPPHLHELHARFLTAYSTWRQQQGSS